MTPFHHMLAEIVNKHLALHDKSLRWLAGRLCVAPSTVSSWANEETFLNNGDHLIRMIDILYIREKAERDFLLAAARYSLPQQEPTEIRPS